MGYLPHQTTLLSGGDHRRLNPRRCLPSPATSPDSFSAKVGIFFRFRASSSVGGGSMASTATWFRYFKTKLNYSLFLVAKTAEKGEIQRGEMGRTFWKNLLHGKISFLHWIKGEEMSPTIAASGGTLLVRKIPYVDPLNVFIGDVVVLKDPEDSSNLLVRRLAAVEGHEMVSTDDKDEPFVLEEDECWVVADNKSIKPKEARDSRVFGPVPLSSICGRVMYSLQTRVDHGPVQNSKSGMDEDYPVLAAELDVDEMAENHKS